MLDYIDLYSLLKNANGNKIDNVIVYGRVVSKLPRPTNLHSNVSISSASVFAKMEVFAVNLRSYRQELKQLGIFSKNDIYMVNGSVACVINPRAQKLPDWYETTATIRLGSKDLVPYVTVFRFVKDGKDWVIKDNTLDDIDLSDWDEDSRVYLKLSYCAKTGVLTYENDVLNLIRFNAQPNNLLMANGGIGSEIKDVMPRNQPFNYSPVPFKKEDRDTVKPLSKEYSTLADINKTAQKLKSEFITSLAKEYVGGDTNNKYIDILLNNIFSYFRNKRTEFSLTGRAILSKYLKSSGKLAETDCFGVPVHSYLIDNYYLLQDLLINEDKSGLDSVSLKLCNKAFANLESFYAFALATCLGTSTEDFVNSALDCSLNGISFSKLVNKNPYILYLVSGLSLKVVEDIALVLNLDINSISKYRNIVLLDSRVNGSSSSSTIFSIEELKAKGIGVSLTQRQYNYILSNGTNIKDSVIESIKTFIKPSAVMPVLDVSKFVKLGSNYVESINGKYLDTILSDYIGTGMGVKYNNFITSSSLLNKELYVYKYLHDLAEEETEFTKEEIDTYRLEYEEELGFKLEDKQIKGSYLLLHKSGVLTGGAGSGKTTISNFFVYCVLKKYPKAELKFAAPTGKAAKRMQEVVKRPVKTMCSMFKTMSGFESIFSKEDAFEAGNNCYYFFDENAMVTIDLLYNCLRRINNSCIYLFGDFQQLPPIGKGLPFKNLLRFMPCVFLDVSKRAKEGSNITRTSDIINNQSNDDCFTALESKDDFLMHECGEELLSSMTVDLVKHYLGELPSDKSQSLARKFGVQSLPIVENLTPDDIQIVTPLAKNSYTWGANRLNSILQPIFNKTNGYNNTIVHYFSKDNYNIFRINDRVIHVESNKYGMQWYSTYKGGVFQKRWGSGVNNGDVGKIVGFYKASSCTILPESDVKPEDFSYPSSLRDDSCYDENDWFIVVEYFDYMSDSNFYILYKCSEVFNTEINIGRCFNSEDLGLLNLFYAGTTHKLQGSQAKIILSPLGSVSFKGFITRNMMYTLYTRGISLVMTYGSVGNSKSSMLSRARLELSEDGTRTLGEFLQ